MHSTPLISVCIFNYNYGRFLRDSVGAALAQTYENIEVVVCDNASTDDSMDVLAEFASNPRLRVFRNPENIGWMQNHKRTIELALGTYAVAIPADDVLLPSFCTNAYAFLAAHRATTDAVYASVAYTDLSLSPYVNGSCIGLLPGRYTGGRNEFRELLRMDHIRWPVLLAPRETLLRFADFDENLHAQADWDALLAMSASGIRFGYLPEVQALIRRHSDQCSADGAFVGTSRELEDYLAIHERYTQEAHHWRFHGIEQTLLGDFRYLLARIESQSLQALPQDLRDRGERYTEHLEMLASAPAPRRPISEPRVSVIVTTDGARPSALRRALASLDEQEEQCFEIVIVQSGGESLEAWTTTLPLAEKIRFFSTSHKLTAAAARNIGIRLSTGEYIAYLDDDTTFAPTHLSQALALLESTRTAAVCANTSVTIDGMRAIGMLGVGGRRIAPSIAPMVPAAALVHHFACLEQTGYFAENLPILDDWHFFLSLAARCEIIASEAATVELDMPGSFFGSAYALAGVDTFIAITDMIYRTIPVLTRGEEDARSRYLEQITTAWPKPGDGTDATREFMQALAGKGLSLQTTAR